MNILQKKISDLALQVTEGLGFLLIEVVYKGDERNRIIQIFIDSETGVSADDCAAVSFQLAKILEEQDLIPYKYRLEVSSPGTERPLKFLKQFPKHLNRKFEVIYHAEEEMNKIEGKLIQIDGEDLYFSQNKNELMINFNKIKSAKVIISF
ncbi:MAG: ribosome maturation factor RimP [Ignavibacteriales bacterium]|nr:ribosome maturation factor RimP [Ignavibacteriales bacterium]